MSGLLTGWSLLALVGMGSVLLSWAGAAALMWWCEAHERRQARREADRVARWLDVQSTVRHVDEHHTFPRRWQ